MRLVIPTLAVALAAGLVGCSQGTGPTPPDGTPPLQPFRPRGDALESARLDLGGTIREMPVEAAADGAWQVRRTVRPGGGPREMARAPGAPMADAVEKSESGDEMDGGVAVAIGGGAGGSFGGRGGARTGGAVGGGGAAPPAPASAAPAKSPAPRPGLEPSPADGDEEVSIERLAARDERGGANSAPARNLKAGATDDNTDYEKYLEFLATWVDRKDVRELFQPMDVRDRRLLRVTDARGAPVPGAIVSVVDEEADRVLFTGTTYGDGRVAYYPHMVPHATGGDSIAPTSLLVEAYLPGDDAPVGTRTVWDGESQEFEIVLDGAPALADPLQLDVCLLIDTTGSMADEIASIKQALLRMTQKLRSLDREFDLRYGAVLYRDIGDDYLTAKHPFTSDVEAFDKALVDVEANGGGDGPESLNQGLAQAIGGVDWRPRAAKVVFLIADAQPHMDYAGDVPYGESLRAAVAKGVRVHSVAASGLNPVGTLVFRQIAQQTRGKFIFIEYGTTAATAESHGVAGNVKSNNLEDILFEQIRDELAHYGRE